MDARIIDTNAKRIRARLYELNAGREWIMTIRGAEYIFTRYCARKSLLIRTNEQNTSDADWVIHVAFLNAVFPFLLQVF